MESVRKIVQVEVRPQQSKKTRRTRLVALGAVVVLAVAAAGAWYSLGLKHLVVVRDFETAVVAQGAMTVTSTASGTVVLPQTISVTAPQTGYADRVWVKEGDTVAEGTLLATLSVPDLLTTQADTQAQLKIAKIAYDDLAVDWDYSLQTTRTSLARAEVTIAKDQTTVNTKKELSTLKSSLKTEYETALETLKTDTQKRDDLAAQLSNYLQKKELGLAKQKATIEALQLSLDKTTAEIESARIKSPITGEVLSIASTLSVPKSLITQYDVLIKVADPSLAYVDMEVNETDAGSLNVGDKMTLTVSAKTLVAVITSIGKVAALSSDGLTATVTVRVKPTTAVTLTPGASAAATLTLGSKAGALTLPRGAFLTTGAQKYVYVVQGSTARKTTVTFGTLQSDTVEVKSGLKAGDVVIVSGYQDFIDQDLVQIQPREGETK